MCNLVSFRELQLKMISLNFKTCCNLKIRGLGAKRCVAFIFFHSERNYNVLKSKSPCILLNKNIIFNIIKTKRNRKWKIPYTGLEGKTLRFGPYKNRKLKVTLCWAGGSWKKKDGIFCTAYFVRRIFLIFVLS